MLPDLPFLEIFVGTIPVLCIVLLCLIINFIDGTSLVLIESRTHLLVQTRKGYWQVLEQWFSGLYCDISCYDSKHDGGTCADIRNSIIIIVTTLLT